MARSAYLVKSPTSDGIEAALDRIKQASSPAAHQAAARSSRTMTIERQAIVELLGYDDIEVSAVGSGAEALQALRSSRSIASCSTCGCPT